jgi:Peptidase family M48
MKHFRSMILSLITCLVVPAINASELPRLSAVSLSSTSVVGGNSLRGTVSLNMAAPFDVEVSLAADPSSVAKVPPRVKIPAGSASATFTISTLLSKSAVGGSDIPVTIYGNYGETKNASFTALAPVSFDQIVDRVISRERTFVASMKQLHPLAETYIQNLREDKEHNVVPASDQYFLARLDLSNAPADQMFEDEGKSSGHHFLNPFATLFSRKFVPQGFAQMVMLDTDFKKSNYYFNFVRQEFLGEVRCIVVDVEPREDAAKGRFTGRIWVEDRDFNIVRFNGTYSDASRYSHYLHFDSWRLNLQPGLWLPSYIYSEESESKRSTPPFHSVFFKAQTRLWSYDTEGLKHPQEFTQVQVDTVEDQTDSARNAGPVEAQRMWERLAEDNALDHLQKVGLLAPQGSVDKILQTVVNNLIITNKLEIAPAVRCRVLLTSPLESFTVGHTIVISRGLLDVLPDEASLAMILAHELSHIALGHKINTKFAFNDRFFFPDTNTFQRLEFTRNADDEAAADRKGMALLANSPYKDKLANAGLFLKALELRAPALTSLIRSHMGNRLENGKTIRMPELLASAPPLEAQKIDQIAALPLGGRIKLDPWSNRLEMMNITPVALLSPQEKMPFEVTPFFPYLTRLSTPAAETLALK